MLEEFEKIRFKVEKIKKYEKQYEDASIKTIRNTFYIGFFALCSAMGMGMAFVAETLVGSGIGFFGSAGGAVLSLLSLKRMLEAIIRKTTLSIKIDDMKDELIIDEDRINRVIDELNDELNMKETLSLEDLVEFIEHEEKIRRIK